MVLQKMRSSRIFYYEIKNESLHVPGAFRAEWMNCSRVQREDLLLLSEMHLLFCWSDKRRHLKAFPRDKKQQINNKELMVSLHLK